MLPFIFVSDDFDDLASDNSFLPDRIQRDYQLFVRISDEAATTTNTLVPRFASSLISVWNIFASTPVGLILGR